ncbi:MAG: hypothetical protein E7079_03470 [Bacteroidales bacterium]|nr:hypothetical protein [Bacteroidales bacterium]
MNIKHSLYGLLCGTLMLASCSSDEPTAPSAQKVEASFSLNIAGEVATRAGNSDSSLGGAQNLGAENLNYILALYEVGENDALILSDFCQVSDRDGDGECFSPMVTLGKTYMMVALAHFGDKRNIADADKTDYLKTMQIENIVNSEAEDFYVATKTARFTVDNLQHALTLKRPYAKLRIVATDYPAATTISSVSIDYGTNTLFNRFDALTQQFSDATVSQTLTAEQYSDATDATAKTIVADYFPVNANVDTYLQAFTVTVTLRGGSSISRFSRTFNDIPLQRNALTTLSGAFFSSQSQMKCDITND